MDLEKNCSENSFILNDPDCENILGSLRNHQITATELLLSSSANISRKLNKTEDEVINFIKRYEAETMSNVMQTLKSPLLEDKNKTSRPICFTIGDESIDRKLNGGVPLGCLIEVSGKSSCGKTNLLLTLSITIQLPLEFGGLGPSLFTDDTAHPANVRTLYVPTESPLPTQRLKQIVENFSNLLQTNGIPVERHDSFPKLDNVLTTSNVITNLEEQDHILKYQLPVMLERDPSIKLLIIDSLTHHIRAQLSWFKQIEYVRSTCTYLKKLAKKFDITIIIANQVTDKPVRGLYTGGNDILWKLNTEYQLAWMSGWDDVGVIYRQLLKREGVIDEGGKSFERLDYLDDIHTQNNFISSQAPDSVNHEAEISMLEDSMSTQSKNDIRNILKLEKKRLFDSNYKVQVSGIGTRPALGLSLLEFIDMRIVLSKEYKPILDETLINEFTEELGINTSNVYERREPAEGNDHFDYSDGNDDNSVVSDDNTTGILEMSTQVTNNRKIDQKQIVAALANNSYLKNYNFQTFRTLKGVFGPLIPPGETRKIGFEIWKGGLRKHNK